jgi:hypothetical protein
MLCVVFCCRLLLDLFAACYYQPHLCRLFAPFSFYLEMAAAAVVVHPPPSTSSAVAAAALSEEQKAILYLERIRFWDEEPSAATSHDDQKQKQPNSTQPKRALPPATLATLQRIQRCQCYAVPFENLSIHRNAPYSLQFDDLFDKIVTRRLGMFCPLLVFCFVRVLLVI